MLKIAQQSGGTSRGGINQYLFDKRVQLLQTGDEAKRGKKVISTSHW